MKRNNFYISKHITLSTSEEQFGYNFGYNFYINFIYTTEGKYFVELLNNYR